MRSNCTQCFRPKVIFFLLAPCVFAHRVNIAGGGLHNVSQAAGCQWLSAPRRSPAARRICWCTFFARPAAFGRCPRGGWLFLQRVSHTALHTALHIGFSHGEIFVPHFADGQVSLPHSFRFAPGHAPGRACQLVCACEWACLNLNNIIKQFAFLQLCARWACV